MADSTHPDLVDAGGFFEIIDKMGEKTPGICHARRCSMDIPERERYCSKHKVARWRANNPARARYLAVKELYRRHGKELDMSFEEWAKQEYYADE